MSAAPKLRAPFPWFGGKSSVADLIWSRFGRPKQYIEPFCGSAAALLASPTVASLEVIGDGNFYVANFWRAVKCQPEEVLRWQDYPVSHVDLYARHRWLTDPARTSALRDALTDADWPGDAKVAGWWVWGQCAWIGSGWCDGPISENLALGQIPHSIDSGRGVHSLGQASRVGNPGRGAQSIGKIPCVSSAGQGVTTISGGNRVASLADRLRRVRVIHGDWTRCLNHNYGGADTAILFDPPYLSFESLYSGGDNKRPVALDVADWARDHPDLRIALCGHIGDYDMPGWDAVTWTRPGATYKGSKTRDQECIWFSPGCERPRRDLFDLGGAP